MARPCSICVSPHRDRVDVELVGGATPGQLARRFKLGDDSIRRHQQSHLTPALVKVAMERRSDDSARDAEVIARSNIRDRVQTLLGQLEGLMDVGLERKSLVGAATVARELRQTIELQARLDGVLDDRAQNVTVVNVLSSPEFTSIVGRLIDALAPFPEARLAAAEVLDVEEVP